MNKIQRKKLNMVMTIGIGIDTIAIVDTDDASVK